MIELVLAVLTLPSAAYLAAKGSRLAVPDHIAKLGKRVITMSILVALPLGLLIWALVTQLQLDATMISVIASAGGLVVGWIVTFLLQQYDTLETLYRTKRDILAGLRTEILTFVIKLDDIPLRKSETRLRTAILSGGDGASRYHPVPSRESPPEVFNAVSGQITLLNEAVLNPILRFYAAYSDLANFVDDFRSADFKALGSARRAVAHADLTQNRRVALYWGLAALSAIDRALYGEKARPLSRSGLNPDIAFEFLS